MQIAAEPVALFRSAKPGVPAPWQAAGGGLRAQQQQLPQVHMRFSSIGATALTPECAAGPSTLADAGKAAERQLQSQQHSLVRRFQRAWPVPGSL